jgi:hypothetical protein
VVADKEDPSLFGLGWRLPIADDLQYFVCWFGGFKSTKDIA